MSSSPFTWLPLNVLKQELRIPTDVINEDLDSLLTNHIESSVSYIENQYNVPLIDKQKTKVVVPIDGLLQLGSIPYFVTVNEIKYYEDRNNYVQDNSVIIEAGLTAIRSVNKVVIYPRDESWPSTIYNNEFTVTYTIGLRASEFPYIRQALILLCRRLFNGWDEVRARSAVDYLLKPLNYFGAIDAA